MKFLVHPANAYVLRKHMVSGWEVEAVFSQ
jgi:hypothetical protein